jgi:phospholipase D1/2
MKWKSFLSYGEEGDKTLLHGLLHIKIIRATNLTNLDGIRGMDRLNVFIPDFIANNKSDPFVTISADDQRLAKTSTKNDDLNPEWNETFYVPVAHYIKGLSLKVYDLDLGHTHELIGKTFVPVEELVKFDDATQAQVLVGMHKVAVLTVGSDNNNNKPRGQLEFFLEFIPRSLLANSPLDAAVPGVYFKSHSGNAVQLYVNADDGVDMAPEVRYGGPNDDEKVWQPPRLWRDIYDAICDAKHFIYITGWAVDTTQSLLRGEEQMEALAKSDYSPFIGELLKQKADEGVTVDMLVWDDATSNSNLLRPVGVLGTHDEQSKAFFQNTKVTFRLAPMLGGKENILKEKLTKFVLFTHHQKIIVLDAKCKVDPYVREPLAFVGGVDLTDGRWDNRKHPLFRTLNTLHKDDFYNGCIPTASPNVGPRQPWHDIHSSLRGPAVLDVIANFRERWYKQASDAVGELLDLGKLGLNDPPIRSSQDAWCSQVLRSIDERTAVFDKTHIAKFKKHNVEEFDESLEISPLSIHKKGAKTKIKGFFQKGKEKLKEAKDALKNLSIHDEASRTFKALSAENFTFALDLWLKKGRYVDTSMHKGWVHHIRRAKHTLYIESQYFLGSSHLWTSQSATKCENLIPTEITLKICEKIHQGERFAAYILIPMWPEGVPESAAVQAILHWQKLTMESMYKRIAETLQKEGRFTESPKDYLNFYALAKREIAPDATSIPQSPLMKQVSSAALANRTGRHQIYVHSKMLIVDDAVTIIGSANINQRSMDGTRDSEIGVASFQPAFLPTETSIPHGDVHGFRLHCWATITNKMEDVFRDPSSIQCVRRMNAIAEENWYNFVSPHTVEMDSHLIPYPVEIDDYGNVLAHSANVEGFFPDTKASVLGTPSLTLPDILTT